MAGRLKRISAIALAILMACLPGLAIATDSCTPEGVLLRVLGSGGPEATDGRVSTSYLLSQDGTARLLIDMGSGSFFNFERSGASLNTLDAVLFTHFHVDHANDLPALVKASYFTRRDRDLPVIGPSGNDLMPSATAFVQALFGPQGAYRYLGDFLDGSASYRLLPQDVDISGREPTLAFETDGLKAWATPVHHGPIPALAWRVQIDGRSVVFSGDMSGSYGTLPVLARDADLLVAHNAIEEGATGVARKLHMPPSVIGEVAHEAHVKRLVLSHRMNRTLGHEKETLENIRKHYAGPVEFAEDMQCFRMQL